MALSKKAQALIEDLLDKADLYNNTETPGSGTEFSRTKTKLSSYIEELERQQSLSRRK
jgi:hypothetical protein